MIILNSIGPIANIQNLHIIETYDSGENELVFEIPLKHERYKDIFEEIGLTYADQNYIIKSIDEQETSAVISCRLDCGAPLIRRTWSNKKIVWQCSNYIRNGKQACKGTKIENNIITDVNIQEPTIVREEFKNGENYYSYTIKAGSPRRQFFNNTK